jgi:transcriptional regulator with XRE-family HTH domain
MTKERLRFVIEHCYRRHRIEGDPARYEDTARFLGVTPMTLRRWLRGERPVPRWAAVILEIFHHLPEIDGKAVDKWVEEE